MTPAEQKAFAELAKFAAARSRGATVLVNAPNGQPVKYPSDDYGCGRQFNAMAVTDGWRIKEIIEPTVLRDWTFNDAMKHLGFSIRRTGAKEDVYTINRATHCKPFCDFTFSEYATPIPGTDPAKWDWRPCKVEVPAEKAKAKADPVERLRELVNHMTEREQLGKINAGASGVLAELRSILTLLESP